MPQVISATQKAISQPWCLAMVLNGSPDRKPPTEGNTMGRFTPRIREKQRAKTGTVAFTDQSLGEIGPCLVHALHILLIHEYNYNQSTYSWPSGRLWRAMSHSSWTGRSHWLWLQTMLLVHKRKNQKQLPSLRSRPGRLHETQPWEVWETGNNQNVIKTFGCLCLVPLSCRESPWPWRGTWTQTSQPSCRSGWSGGDCHRSSHLAVQHKEK